MDEEEQVEEEAVDLVVEEEVTEVEEVVEEEAMVERLKDRQNVFKRWAHSFMRLKEKCYAQVRMPNMFLISMHPSS